MRITLEVSGRKIADQMVAAIEGGSAYWCRSIRLKQKAPGISLRDCWYDTPELYDDRHTQIEVVEHEPSKEGRDGRHRFGKAQVAKGLRIMAEKYPQQFGYLIGEEGDADTADIFLQCVVFGEVVYG